MSRPINEDCAAEREARDNFNGASSWCATVTPMGWGMCNRPKGHDGPHVATGLEVAIGRWLDGETGVR
jgi:hypothetical protein